MATRKIIRARRPEDKAERRERLLATARAMLAEGHDLRTLTLSALARRAAMTKSNVYRYFETREAVLLELLRQEWTAWLAELAGPWPAAEGSADALDAAVGHLARTLAARRLLCLLASALPTVVEQNLGDEAIAAFKRESLALFETLAAALVARAPQLSPPAATQLVHDAVAVLVGLYPLAHPAEAAARAMRAPELRCFARDFAEDVERFLRALARDLARGA